MYFNKLFFFALGEEQIDERKKLLTPRKFQNVIFQDNTVLDSLVDDGNIYIIVHGTLGMIDFNR